MTEARWLVPPAFSTVVTLNCELEVASPLSIAAGAGDASGDQPVLRDGNGRPFLPGTALVGQHRARMRHLPQAASDWMFGPAFGGDDAPTGVLWVEDAPLLGTPNLERRDHVRLEPFRGVAANRAKYDRETVAVGSTFPWSFELRLGGRIRESGPEVGDSNPLGLTDEQLLTLATFFASLTGSDGWGPMRLGGRTSRGFGEVRMRPGSLAAAAFRLANPSDLAAWIVRSEDTRAVCIDSIPRIGELLGLTLPPPAQSERELEIHLRLRNRAGLIVRGAARAATRDVVHAASLHRREGDKQVAVLPGTSVAGACRARARAIEVLVRKIAARELVQVGTPTGAAGVLPQDDQIGVPPATPITDYLFGSSAANGSTPDAREMRPRPSRIAFAEAVIEGARELRHTRVAIDPWTGGALDHCLFTEDVQYGGTLELSLRLCQRQSDDPSLVTAARGLLFLTLRDLWEGDLPVGGEVGAGRGDLRAVAGDSGRIIDTTGEAIQLSFDKRGRLKTHVEGANEWVGAFKDYCRNDSTGSDEGHHG